MQYSAAYAPACSPICTLWRRFQRLVNWSPSTLRSRTITGTPWAHASATTSVSGARLVRRDDQQVDALGEEVLDVGDLLGVVLGGVGEDDLQLGVGRGGSLDVVDFIAWRDGSPLLAWDMPIR